MCRNFEMKGLTKLNFVEVWSYMSGKNSKANERIRNSSYLYCHFVLPK